MRSVAAVGHGEGFEATIHTDPDEQAVVVAVYRRRFGIIVALRSGLLYRAVVWAQRPR